jgi:hypothetical protein
MRGIFFVVPKRIINEVWKLRRRGIKIGKVTEPLVSGVTPGGEVGLSIN